MPDQDATGNEEAEAAHADVEEREREEHEQAEREASGISSDDDGQSRYVSDRSEVGSDQLTWSVESS